jgi:hypothetical protein
MTPSRHQRRAKGSRAIPAVILVAVLAIPSYVLAHWCSNIYQTFARIVVKPERDTINIGVGSTGELKVRVRNNFPYAMRYLALRVTPPAGLNVTVSPTQSEAEQVVVRPGHERTFTLTIERTAAGSDDVSDLNLEVRTGVEGIGPMWMDADHDWVDPNPTEAEVRNRIDNPQQSRAINNALLADMGCADCELDGVSDLISMWDAVDGDFENTNGHQWIRAGQALAIRLRYRNFNNPSRSTVVQSMIDGMGNSFDISRGLAAFFGAYGGDDPGVGTGIGTMASSDSSTTARRMAMAAQLILGGNTTAEVTACLNDGGEAERARMVCAAALGIMGDDDPILDYLIPHATSGSSSDYPKLLGGYLLQLVVFSRRGGPEGVGEVSFLDEEVVTDDVPPKAPTGLSVQPAS